MKRYVIGTMVSTAGEIRLYTKPYENGEWVKHSDAEAELAAMTLERDGLALQVKMRPTLQADMVPAEELAAAQAERDRAEADRDAIRELMNVYNLGGWTDALEPMKRALKAEAERDALRADAERYRWLTDDHADAATRAKVRLIAGSIAISGKGYTDAAIDAARGKA